MPEAQESRNCGAAIVLSRQPDITKTIRTALADSGLDIVECRRLTAALPFIERSQAGLIVIDAVANPDKALEYCRQCRKEALIDDLPIVVLIGGENVQGVNLAYECGASHVFVSPFAPEFLNRMLPTLVRKEVLPVTLAANPELPDAVIELDAKARVIRHIGGGESDAVLGFARLVGRCLAETWPREIVAELRRQLRKTLACRGDTEFEIGLPVSPAGRRAYSVRLIAKGRDRVQAVFRDCGERTDTSDGPEEGDRLTGCMTREAFLSGLSEIIADCRLREHRVALVCVDLDGFGKLNATFGRPLGDAVLRISAERLQTCVRGIKRTGPSAPGHGATPGRTGSDEFSLVIGGAALQEATQRVADRLHQAFADPVQIDGRQVPVRISIGAAIHPVDGVDATRLYESAQAALDEARTHGRNSVTFYSDTIRTRALRRVDSAAELRWAFEQDQLDLHYLPRVDLATGEISELEALLRWHHPLRRNIPISEIIPLAETTGLIEPLGDWILRKACADAAHWEQTDSPAPRVSVNLSEQEFLREPLADVVEAALTSAGLPAPRLQLEITERTAMKHGRAACVVEQLKQLGVQIAMDDFGTGPSSLSLLAQLPIDAVKVDRSYVSALREKKQRAMCAAIVAMARALGIVVIAEGVETLAQVSLLRDMGCDAAQGFLYTEPVPSAEVTEFLASFDARGTTVSVAGVVAAVTGS